MFNLKIILYINYLIFFLYSAYSLSYIKTGKLINISITCINCVHYNLIKLSYNTLQPMQSRSLLGYYDSQQGQNSLGQNTENQIKQQMFFNDSKQSSNREDISQNQSGSNSDFQQCHNEAKKSRIKKKWRNPLPSIVPPPPLNLKLLPLLCQDCKQDCYDEQHIQIINYSLKQQRPARISETNDMGKRYKMINNLRIRSSRYSIKHCVHGTPHLFNGTLQIPMLLSTLKFLDDAHLRTHGDQNQTRKNLHQIPLNIDKRIFRKYLYKYLDECRECKRKKSIFRLPLIAKYRSNIFQSISQIPQLKLKMCTNPDNQIQEINHEKPVLFNLRQCFYDCSRDNYQRRFQDIVDFICSGKYPQAYNKLSKKDKIKKKQVLRVLASKFRVFNCNDKVPHLWRIPKIIPDESFDQPQKAGYLRLPMLHQFLMIATKLHTQFGHHSVTRFSQMMRNSGFDRSTLKKYFYNGLSLCSKCEKQKIFNPIIKKTQNKKKLPNSNFDKQIKQENQEQQSDPSAISYDQQKNYCRRGPLKQEQQVYEQNYNQYLENKKNDFNIKYQNVIYNKRKNGNQIFKKYQQNSHFTADPVYNYNESGRIKNYEEKIYIPSKLNQYSQRNEKKIENQKFSTPLYRENSQYEYNTNLNRYKSQNYKSQTFYNSYIKDPKQVNISTKSSKFVDYYDDSDDQLKNVDGIDQYINDQYIILDDQIKQKINLLEKSRFEVILEQNEISMKKLSKILLMSNGMKKKLAIVGESVYFTKVPQLNAQGWSTYIFLGFGRAAEALILGIFLCINKKKKGLPASQVEGDYKDFYFAFSSFFGKCIILNAFPFCLQTDYQCSEATKALESLMYYTNEAKIKQLNHRYSCQSFFQFVQKNLLSQNEFKKVQNNLLNILKTYDQKVYESEMKHIHKYIQNKETIRVLQSQFRQICPAFLKPFFIVGRLERGAMKAFNKVISQGGIEKKLPLLQFLTYSIRIQEQIYRSIQESEPMLNPIPGKAVNLMTQRTKSIVPLATIINVLSSRIASQFLKTLEKATFLNVEKNRDLFTEITVIDIHGNHTVVFNVQYNHWECSCKRIYMEGLPCQHLLRVAVIEYNGDPLYYINTRWWIDKRAS